jgi:hypothetical protein
VAFRRFETARPDVDPVGRVEYTRSTSTVASTPEIYRPFWIEKGVKPMIRMSLIAAILYAGTGLAWAEPATVQHGVETEQKPWTHLELKNDPENFQFAIVTDRTGGHRPGVFMDGVQKLNLLQPEFVVSVGDLIEGYTEDQTELDREWDEFNGFVAQLEMPFFYTPGNHDLSNEVMVQEWLDRFGVLYYHFVYRDVLFLCLDSEDPPNSHISAEQIAYVEKALAENLDVRWTIVLLHKPLWVYEEDNGWSGIEAALAGRRHTVFAGHTHNYKKIARNDANYIVLATMGGGSQLRGANFGEFDHFMWVTMTDEGPIMASLMLDGIWDTNIITEERLGLIRPAFEGALVRTEGIILDQTSMEQTATVLRLTNDADIPVNIKIRIEPTDSLRASVETLDRTVQPNSVDQIDLTLLADAPTPVDALKPVRVDWTARYDLDDNVQPVIVNGQHRIVIDKQFHLETASAPITVDGDLSEWSELPVDVREPGQVVDTRNAWHGRTDASWRFAVVHDSEFIYIGARVDDDQIQLDARRDFTRQDSIEVRLDARPADARDKGPYTDFETNVFFAVIPGQDPAEIPGLDRIPGGSKAIATQIDGGYVFEAAIPLEYVKSLQGEDWTSVRVNVTVNDFDSDGNGKLWWRPSWSSPANYAESGVFAR